LFADDRDYLLAARDRIEAFLISLRLKLHPTKTQIFATDHGANFVGFRILPDRIRLRADNLQRGRRRLRQLNRSLVAGKITAAVLTRSQQSWQAHLAHGNTWRLSQKLFS
jgi:RNA-directed DNA polymerase